MGAAERIAEEQFTEAEAARKLTMSKSTLVRLRLMGKIQPMRLSPRIIRYTEAILDEYRQRCPDTVEAILARASECRTPFVRESGVYLLYLADEVVYVGVTGNFMARLAAHECRKQFDSYAFLRCEPERAASIERTLISELRPRLNMAWNPDNPTSRRTR